MGEERERETHNQTSLHPFNRVFQITLAPFSFSLSFFLFVWRRVSDHELTILIHTSSFFFSLSLSSLGSCSLSCWLFCVCGRMDVRAKGNYLFIDLSPAAADGEVVVDVFL